MVHQALHGYRRGHQLLATSRDFDDEVAHALGHNSDSAPRSRGVGGNYLTGYPLPSGEYVLARTWTDAEAERPNTVVTRSLVLPRARSSRFSATRVLERLVPPSAIEVEGGRLDPIDGSELEGDLLTLMSDEASEATVFYVGSRRLFRDTTVGRERIVLALWQQIWSSARQRFYFCTAPDTSRFARVHDAVLFDAEPSGRSAAASSAVNGQLQKSLAMLRADLLKPGRLREFIHFVGSGEPQLELITMFAAAFDLLGRPRAAVPALPTLIRPFGGDNPARLRRLKRRFLSYQGPAPAWDVKPLDMLASLAEGELGRAIYASDASLDRWLRAAWTVDPEATARLILSGQRLAALPQREISAAQGIAMAFTSEAPTLITPETLNIAVAIDAAAALAVVWNRNDNGMWRAWAALESRVEVPSGYGDAGDYDWDVPLAALRSNASALKRLLRRHPPALDTLIVLADREPAASDSQVGLDGDARRCIKSRLSGRDPYLRGLARVASLDELPGQVDVPSWGGILDATEDELVLSALYLIARSNAPDLWELGARALAILYRMMAADQGVAAWHRLSPRIVGDRAAWDRCARLADDFVKCIRQLDDHRKASAIEVVRTRNPAAATALLVRLAGSRSDKKKANWWDPFSW